MIKATFTDGSVVEYPNGVKTYNELINGIDIINILTNDGEVIAAVNREHVVNGTVEVING